MSIHWIYDNCYLYREQYEFQIYVLHETKAKTNGNNKIPLNIV